MRKAVLILAVVLLMVGIFAVAALTQIEINRDITVSIASDIDENVAVKFTVGEGYEDVAKLVDGDNYIEFDLAGALENALHYNTEAVFVIGAVGAGNGVFTITNNTNTPIIISTDTITAGVSDNLVQLRDVNGDVGDVTLSVGAEEEFHFYLDTAGALADAPDADPLVIEIELQIRQVP